MALRRRSLRRELRGRVEGREQSTRLISVNLFKSGMSINQIAQIVEVNIEKLQEWFQDVKINDNELD